MGMYDTFETDSKMEEAGVIIDYGDFRVRIATAGQGNPAYVRYLDKKMKPIRQAMSVGAISNERSVTIMIDIYVNTIILDWQVKVGEVWKSGIEDRSGTVLPFTKENVQATLTSLPHLFSDLQTQATSIANFRKAELDTEAGN